MVCFFNDDYNISPMIFHSQLQFEHTLGEKRTAKQNNFTFRETNIFSLKCPTLHTSKINLGLDILRLKMKQKKLLDNKS